MDQEEGNLSQSRGYYRQGASISAQDENSEELGEWSESSDVPDEVLGDFKRFRVSKNLIDKLKGNNVFFCAFPSSTILVLYW